MNYIEEQAFEKLLELVKDRNWRLSSGFYLIESKPDNDPNAPGRITPFVMRKEQAEVLATRHTRNFRPKARKLGISSRFPAAPSSSPFSPTPNKSQNLRK